MTPTPTFRFLELPDGLTPREEKYCIQLTRELATKGDYRKACETAEGVARNFIAARNAARKGPALNLIVTALPVDVVSFSADHVTGEVSFTLSEAISEADMNILQSVLLPAEITKSAGGKELSLRWE